MKKKKSNILYKSVGFIVILSLIVVVVISVNNIKTGNSYNEFDNTKNITADVLGYETFNNIKKGNNIVACKDAQELGKLFIQINKELKQDEELLNDNISQYAISSPAKQIVDEFSNNLVQVVKDTYISDNLSLAQSVFQIITQDIYVNITQPSIMIETGNISEKEFYDYINIHYCNVTPPQSYISPHDIVIYSINSSEGRKTIDKLNDNISKKNQ